MRKSKKPTWSAAAIANLPLPRAGENCRDTSYRLISGKNGLSARVRVFSSGARAVSVKVMDGGKKRWRQVRLVPATETWTDALLESIKSGCLAKQAEKAPAKPQEAMTLIKALDTWYSSEVEKIQIRASETKRYIDRHIRPHDFANRSLTKLTHSNVTTLLSDVESNSTPIIAERMRIKLLTALKFYRDTQNPSYIVPITKAMKKDKRQKEEQSRDRVLTDVEIMHLWKACEEADTAFSQILRLALLVPCRSRKIASMQWQDVNFVSCVWTVPRAPREKGVCKTLKLPEMAMAILRQRKRLNSSQYIFGKAGGKAFSGFSAGKMRIDEILAENGTPIVDWCPHDCRRSSRTLMGRRRLEIDYAIAESLLGHKLGTQVAKVYDKSFDDSEFIADQATALEALATEIKRIVEGRPIEESSEAA
jgi:integrase